jgi:hypothetical protein
MTNRRHSFLEQCDLRVEKSPGSSNWLWTVHLVSDIKVPLFDCLA